MRTVFPTRIRLLAGLILLLGMGLRFHSLAGQSLWSDEGNSIVLARAGLAEIAARTALDIHPPLYYWLLHGWILLVGDSEVAVRSLSACASLLLVAVTYRLGRRLLGPRAAPVAAFAAAVSPFQVAYAQETRMYALLALLGGLTVWAAVELAIARPASPASATVPWPRRRCLRWLLLYVASAALGLYTHYAFPAILAATGLVGLFYIWQTRHIAGRGARTVGWLLCQLLPLMLYLPWAPIAWQQLTTWPAPATVDLRATRVALAGLATIWRTLTMGPAGASASTTWLAVLGFLGMAGVVRLAWRRSVTELGLIVLYLGMPVGLTAALFKPAYLKFLLVAGPAWCLLVAAALVGARPTAQRTAPRIVSAATPWLGCILLAAACWWPLKTYYGDPAYARDDYRGLAGYLAAAGNLQDAVILNAPGQQEVFDYYYHGSAPVYPLPRSRPPGPAATLAEMESVLARSRNIYAVYWATDESDPDGLVEGWLGTHALQAGASWVGNLRLALYAAPLPAGEWLPSAAHFGDHITLTGYRLVYPSAPNGRMGQVARPGDIVQVHLRWLADAPLQTNYVVFVQMLDAANHLVGQRDAPPTLPATQWLPDRPLLDRHGLLILPGTPPGEHRLIAGLYDAVSGARLTVLPVRVRTQTGATRDSTAADFVTLATLAIERPATPPATAALRLRHPIDIAAGPFGLIGYECLNLNHDSDDEARLHPGDPLHIVLTWRPSRQPERDWRVAMRLVAADGAGPLSGEGAYPLAGIDYPTTHWQPGEVVRGQYDLFVPTDATPGAYSLELGLSDETGRRDGVALTLCPVWLESN